MSQDIPVARPSIGDAERLAVQRVLNGTQLTGGAELARFENLLAMQTGREWALAVSSGTTALELSLWALNIGPGDTVLVCAFGFPAAANAVAARGATPIAVDVEADTWCMNFTLAREAIDATTKAIVSIDALGAVASGATISQLQDDTGLPVISDAACGLGGLDVDGRPAGAAGTVATFSFHPRKGITTGEGGAVVGSDPSLAEKLRQLRNHGQMSGGKFVSIGTNGRIDEMSCALGCVQMARLKSMQAERRMLVEGYKERLGTLYSQEVIAWQTLPEGACHANQSFSISLAEPEKRDSLILGLRALGIESGVSTYGFADIGTHKGGNPAPIATRLHHSSVSLPLYVGMRSAELSRVCDGVRRILR